MADTGSLKSKEQLIDDLVMQVQEGSTEAFEKLYNILLGPLYRYVYYRVSADDCEDILEMVFIKVWVNINQYKKNHLRRSFFHVDKQRKNSFIAWVFRIAHNIVVDHYRASGQNAVLELTPEVPDIRRDADSQRLIETQLDQKVLKTALKQLKESYQQVLVLKFLNDLENDEIALILGKNKNSLRILQFRALRSLRKALENMGITEL